jgi:hypothetical protein
MMRSLSPVSAIACSFLCMLLAAGCSVSPYDPLPRISDTVYQRSLPEKPHNGTVLAWRGAERNLHTFWGEQDVRARVRAFIPESWTRAGDGIWRAKVHSGEDKPIPFLGVLRRSGEKSRIIPSVNPEKLPDGLYSLIVPGIEKRERGIASVMPRLLVCEIRDGQFQPFRVAVPLHPQKSSPLTAPPQHKRPKKQAPEGTLYPFSVPASKGS